MTTVYYTATSLDGFIATPDHNLDWLLTRDIDQSGPGGYEPFLASVGALVMGANTYQWLLDHDPGNWGYQQPAWVVTHRRDLPVPEGADVRFTSAPIAQVHEEMVAAAGGGTVWVVGGGDLAGQFADLGLLDEVRVAIAPVALGAGKPLLPRHVELRLREVDRNGEFVVATWELVR